METRNLKSIDLTKLKNKESVIIPSHKALHDIEPIQWSEEVLSGKKKVVVNGIKKNN